MTDSWPLENSCWSPPTLHPCKYCGNSCIGKQCKDCHLRMVTLRNGKCADCGTEFLSVRRDGSVRKRCGECQYAYNQEYISVCPGCGDTFPSKLKDGRSFTKCYKCYRSTVNKCTRCDNNAYNGYALCRECHQSTRPAYTANRGVLSSGASDALSETSERTHIPRAKYTLPKLGSLHECSNKECANKTSRRFCKECYTRYKFAVVENR